MRYLTCIIILLTIVSCSQEKHPLALSPIISDGMVVQQSEPITLWGTSVAGAKIKAKGSWGTEAETVSADGNWKLELGAPEAGGPFQLLINTKDTTITLSDVYSGEVWLASGQSNMEWILRNTDGAQEEIASADLPKIRMFTIPKSLSLEETKNLAGRWEVCTPETAGTFSAIGYFFAKNLNEKLNVPIGIIHTSWGGTPAESWTSNNTLRNLKDFDEALDRIEAAKKDSMGVDDWLKMLKKVSIGNQQVYDLDLGDQQLANPDFEDANWETMNLPALWERTIGNIDGIVWFRKEVVLENEPTGNYELSLGAIDDMDITYINGQEVGRTVGSSTYQIKRQYSIPSGLLKKGKNVIAVKVIDGQGGGGLYGDEGFLKLGKDTETISLAGEWKYLPTAMYMNGDLYLFDFENKLFSQRPAVLNLLDPYTPSILYNAMIVPVIDYNFKGALWYQGESNVGRAKQYLELFPAMIQNWREEAGKPFPFYFVQIAPYQYAEGGAASADLREAQRRTMEKLENTGMAVTLDIGNVHDIHPRNKKDVGDRLSRWALNKDYGMDVVFSGPNYKSVEPEGNKLKVIFDYADGGLTLKGGSGFEIAGEDGQYYPAVAVVEDNAVILSSPKVNQPLKARYAWSDISEATLFNGEGLPASSFSSDWR